MLGLGGKVSAQITSVTAADGRRTFVNAEPPVLVKLTPPKPRASIYMPGEISKQHVDAGVRYLKTLLERYKGNLDLALAAYNAGEGAVDRAHGVPSYRETRNYVQRVQDAYFRPGSGRSDDAYTRANRIHREVEATGRIIFTND